MSQEMEMLNGRPVIRPGTEIIGGVLLTTCPIVVDYLENPAPYEGLFEKIDTLVPASTDPSLLAFARATDQVVSNEVWCSEGTMGAVLRQSARKRGMTGRLGAYDEVNLSEFIIGGGGVCYVQAAIDGVMFALAKERRGLAGRGSVERTNKDPEAHTWYRHDQDDESVVIDNNQAFVGPPDHPSVQGAYLRKDERKAARRARAGRLGRRLLHW